MNDNVKAAVKAFILREFLPGERPEALTDAVPLISSGVLDSLSTLKLVAFLEETFGIELAPHDLGADNLDTLPAIERLVQSRMS